MFRLTLETSALETLYGGQITLSTHLPKPDCLFIPSPTPHLSFSENLPPLLYFKARLKKELFGAWDLVLRPGYQVIIPKQPQLRHVRLNLFAL